MLALALAQTAAFDIARVRGRDLLMPGGTDDGKEAVITLAGDNKVWDFDGMVLRGSLATVEPNERKGTGVRVIGKNVTVRNLKVHGFKIGLIAEDAEGLKIERSDFSYNFKPRLMSTLEREDLSDWMSFHQNEKDEWIRFGAGIYLRNCDRATINRVVIRGGQCGLMITETDGATVINSDFSFLSAVGLGMYRSSNNRIMHNKIDWCLRGYSHGVYNRGQDSTGILIYEQSNKNVFAYNSVTHGGDGFFLWAGQTTMDSGAGGCNDNILYGNDFSHAPTNGIEATFSRNVFANNLVMECWHGVWGGYSYDTQIVGNLFAHNATAIALEHGQDNIVRFNEFIRDRQGIRAWSNPTQDPNWGYPKHRDTRSRDWTIEDNLFQGIFSQAIDLTRTAGVRLNRNRFDSSGAVVRQGDAVTGLQFAGNTVQAVNLEPALGQAFGEWETAPKFAPPAATMQASGNVILGVDPDLRSYLAKFRQNWSPWAHPADLQARRGSLSRREQGLAMLPADLVPRRIQGGMDPFMRPGQLRGRRYMLVDQWGPYDFQSPRLWPRSETAGLQGREVRLEVLGPTGMWRVKSLSPGVKLSEQSGSVPGFVTATIPAGKGIDVDVQLEYTGRETRDYRGVQTPAGRPVAFGWSMFLMPIAWTVSQFNYDSATEDPRTNYDAWKRRSVGAGARTLTELNGAWGGSPAPGINSDFFGTIASGEFEAAPGSYTLNVTSDDGVRVWLDGRLVIENWTYHGPTLDTAQVTLGGKHQLRVEHFELNGYSTLKVELVPNRRQSDQYRADKDME